MPIEPEGPIGSPKRVFDIMPKAAIDSYVFELAPSRLDQVLCISHEVSLRKFFELDARKPKRHDNTVGIHPAFRQRGSNLKSPSVGHLNSTVIHQLFNRLCRSCLTYGCSEEGPTGTFLENHHSKRLEKPSPRDVGMQVSRRDFAEISAKSVLWKIPAASRRNIS